MLKDKADLWLTEKYWVTPYNWLDEVRSQFSLPSRVEIHDATLREGQQTPGIAFKKDEQIYLAQALDELGVSRIEVIPIVSKEDEEATKGITGLGLNAKIISFVSWRKEDTDAALKCDVDGVLVDYIGNPWQGKVFWNMAPEQIIEKGVEAISYAKEHGLFVSALIWDDFKAPLDFVKQNFTAAIKEGHADHITLADTYGFSLPWTTLYVVKKVREWLPCAPLEFHIHNDYGLATAGAIAAVCGGVSVIQSTMCSLGERVGNVATEEIAVALEVLLGIKTGVKLEKIHDVAKLVQDIAKFKVGPNKPIIGSNLFKFSSGWIHWMLRKAEASGRIHGQLPFKPELIGAPKIEYVISKGSGKSLIREKLEEMNIMVSEEELDKIAERVKEEGSIIKGVINDIELRRIVEKVRSIARASNPRRI